MPSAEELGLCVMTPAVTQVTEGWRGTKGLRRVGEGAGELFQFNNFKQGNDRIKFLGGERCD